jgi:hypothetical protein
MRHNHWMPLLLFAIITIILVSGMLGGGVINLQPVPVGAQASRTCSFREDINGDGLVNVADVATLASRWGATAFPIGYDQNFDGRLDARDVRRVARAFQLDCSDTNFDLEWGHYGDAILNEGDDGENAEFRLPEGIDASSVIDWQAQITENDGWTQEPGGHWNLSGTQASHADYDGTFYLVSPRVNLFDVPKPITLTFEYDLDATAPRGWVEISINGSGWVDLDPGPGQSLTPGSGQKAEVSLSDYAFSIVQFRWGLIGDQLCGDPEVAGDCTNYFVVRNVQVTGGIGAQTGMGELPDGEELKPRVYAADTGNHRVQIFEYESDGTSVTYKGEFGYYGDDDGQFHLPEDVVVGPDAVIYVADTGNHRIQYFDADGNFLGQFGSYGDAILSQGDSAEDARFKSPSGVATSAWHLTQGLTNGPQGDYYFLYVADTGNHRIQRFKIEKSGFGFDENGNGEPLYDGEWGYYGDEDGQFNSPEGIDVDPIQTPQDLEGTSGVYCTIENWEAHVYVADTGNHRVQFFTLDGTFVGQFGQYGDGEAEFRVPQDVGVGIRLEGGLGGEGSMVQTCAPRLVDVYVADTGNHRVQYFLWDDQATEHQYQDEFGYYGDASCQFNSEAGVAVDRLLPDNVGLEGDIFVCDTGNHRCQRFSRPEVPLVR